MDLLKLETVSLKHHEQLDEKWVQKQLADDPTLLGLGDMVLKDKERTQPHAGRLDLLLQDPETLKRYEVEIQLGPTDESHIIRTVEYWDIERKRYPQYEHAAVIVAEDITSRFLNVIQLFNGAIPLIALKMTAYKVGDQYALTFVKVLDEQTYGLVDEDEPPPEPTDRAYWVSKASEASVALATNKLFDLVKAVELKASPNYTRFYIGVKVDESPKNFVTFRPQKGDKVVMNVRLDESEKTKSQIEEADIETLPYDGKYRLKIKSPVDDKQREVLNILIRQAWERFGK
jgi:hypothetical protein